MREFLRKVATAKVALLFYAGHGMQIDGKNYLVPVDARITAHSPTCPCHAGAQQDHQWAR